MLQISKEKAAYKSLLIAHRPVPQQKKASYD